MGIPYMRFMKTKDAPLTVWLLGAILILASILRLYRLADYPVHLTPDEASLGFNAWSILKTGADEYGQTLPIVFRSFGDYKPGLYVYLAVPFVAIFGLNELAVRLPSALAGILAVGGVYWLVMQGSVYWVKTSIKSENVALWAALSLAVNPWHVYFSRGAWEANVLVTVCILVAGWLLRGIHEKKSWLLWGSAALAGISLWLYQGAKLSTGFVILAIAISFWRKIIARFKVSNLVLAGAIFGFAALPIIVGLWQGQAGRLVVFSAFSYPRSEEYIRNTVLDPGNIAKDSWIFEGFFNEPLNFVMSIMRHYFNHMSGKFLFVQGYWDVPDTSVPYMGKFYWFEILPWVLGIVFCLRYTNGFSVFLLVWLLVAAIPSSLSRSEVSGVRSLNLVVPMVCLVGIGWQYLLSRISWTGLRNLGVMLILGAYGIGVVYFWDMFFIVQPKKSFQYQAYGWKQVVESAKPYRESGKTVVVNQSYAQPYIYFLFFEKYDPATYQKTASLTESVYGDVGFVEKIDERLLFRPVNWTADKQMKGMVFVGDPVTTIWARESDDMTKFKVIPIHAPNGEEVYRVVEVLDN